MPPYLHCTSQPPVEDRIPRLEGRLPLQFSLCVGVLHQGFSPPEGIHGGKLRSGPVEALAHGFFFSSFLAQFRVLLSDLAGAVARLLDPSVYLLKLVDWLLFFHALSVPPRKTFQ